MSDRSKALPALTGLRFFAAGAVVLYHAEPLVETWPELLKRGAHAGYAAVSLFYVLSGFVLTWNYGAAFAGHSERPRDFFVARVARIYPLYLVGVAWSFALMLTAGVPMTALALPTAASALGLQSWYPPFIWFGNVPGWSISNELFFYLVFPLFAARLLGGASRRRAWVVLAAAWGASFVPFLAMVAAGKADSQFVRFAPICRLPEFVAGMALGRLFVLERAAGQRSGRWLLAAAGLALVLAAWFERSLPYPLFHDGLLVPAFAALVYGLARGGTRVSGWLAARPAVFLGEISYAVYLLHEPLKQTLARMGVRYDGTRAEIWAGHLTHEVALVASAAVVFVVLERPARTWVRSLGAARLRWVAYAGLLLLVAATGWSTRGDRRRVTLVSNFQTLLGCSANWSAQCPASELALAGGGTWTAEQLYSARFTLPAGDWEFKVVVGSDWRENYGARGERNGQNVRAKLDGPGVVEFVYSPNTHWVTASMVAPIVTLVGGHQSQLGCAQAWDPDCLATWMQDPDGDGVYTWKTSALREGRYEAKVARGHAWVNDGNNVFFVVPADGATMSFAWDSATGVLSARP